MAVGLLMGLQLALVVLACAEAIYWPSRLGSRARHNTFSLHIDELGTEFDETVQINVTSNIEIIHVPHHNDVQETHFVLDYNRNLTVRLLPARGRCYVSELDAVSRQMTSPSRLKAILKAAKGKEASGQTIIVRYNWAMTRQLTIEELSRDLPKEAFDMCEGYPVYLLELMQDRVSVSDPHSRSKRQVDLPGGGEQDGCHRVNQKLRCLRARDTDSCRYIYVQTCNDRLEQRRHIAECVDDNTMHIYDSIICCRSCCNSQEQSDSEFFPYCPNVGRDDIPTQC